MGKRIYKSVFGLILFLLVTLFSGCNDYDYSVITVKMTNNQTNTWVYMWVEHLEDKPAYLQQGQSRTFNIVYTFTEENPRTNLTVICDDMGVITSKTFIVNADTTQINAMYNSDGRISSL